MVTGRTADAAQAFVQGPPESLCLDFANTCSWRGSPSPTEELHGPADLLRWCESAGVLDPATMHRFAEHWRAHPEAAEAGFAEAIAIREAVFRIFAAVAAGGAPAGEDLQTLNAALNAAPERSRLRRGEAGYVWELPAERPGVPLLLAPVLWSAGDLLAGARLARVRQCANEKCLWLFVDDSKSGNRRWCSMASCGNRAKAHRHYARQKQKRTE